MKISKYWYKENQLAKDSEDNEFDLNCWAGSDISEEDAKQKARAKIQNWIARLAKNQELGEYDYETGEIREELIEELYNEEQQLIAAITRNRYGALVLNTDAVIIADVDIKPKTLGEFFKGLFGKKIDKRAQCLAHIKNCYQSYSTANFIIYQTFAGFRIIITGHNPLPSHPDTTALFTKLHADSLYARLCRVQQCFRARLSPKPWRCQSSTPPHHFPYLTTKQQNAFDKWLRCYETHSQQYAVCYKIEQLGKHAISNDVDKILARHDDYVLKANKLPLA